MKAVLLAGGFGTRLRPLTLNTPKPVVPIFDRPFLYHQIELLKQLPEIDEVILSLNYQPEAIERVVGDGSDIGMRIRYVVEPTPLGTGGAVKYASSGIDGTVVVFNGDVLTDTDLSAVLDLHRRRDARATIVLTPVENPSAYGLVETSEAGDVRRFLEKPSADEITCNTINAGIYVLDTKTFDRIPANTNWSIEREYFPSLVERGDTFVAYVDRGYWIDIGTPDKYIQVHRDIMTGACHAYPFAGDTTGQPHVATDAVVDPEARLEGPCYIASHARIEAGALIAPHSVIGTSASVCAGAIIDGAVLWPGSTVGPEATIRDAILGRDVTVEDHAVVGPGAVVGDKSHITRYTHIA
jgi:mannose-1-phosphate guanylyltransferase